MPNAMQSSVLAHLLEGFPLGRLRALLGHRLREFNPSGSRGASRRRFSCFYPIGRSLDVSMGVDPMMSGVSCAISNAWMIRFFMASSGILVAGGEDGTRRAEEKIEVLSARFHPDPLSLEISQ